MIKQNPSYVFILMCLAFTCSMASAKDEDIYVLLLKQSNVVIPADRDHCEIDADELTVGIYLSGYLGFLNSKPKRMNTSFYCDNETNEINCSLMYGQTSNFLGHEGWNRILRFKYDFESKKIDGRTYTCIDVP